MEISFKHLFIVFFESFQLMDATSIFLEIVDFFA